MSSKNSERLGDGPYVDRPRGQHNLGYLSRWKAREVFLDVLAQEVPEVRKSLVNEVDLEMMRAPAIEREVRYDAEAFKPGLSGLDNSLEDSLFDREDGLLQTTNWLDIDPSNDPSLEILTSSERRLIEVFGAEGIAQAWSHRRVVDTSMDMSVMEFIRFASVSEDDGEITVECIRDCAPELHRHLQRWAKNWNLDAPWMYWVAFHTLCDVADGEISPDTGWFSIPDLWREWHLSWSDSFIRPSTFSITVNDAWNPRRESTEELKSRIQKQIDRHIQRIRKEIQRDSVSTRIKTVPEHFEWLVRYQVMGQSFKTIANSRPSNRSAEKSANRKTITDAIKDAARLVEIDLRTRSLGGRPSKSKLE